MNPLFFLFALLGIGAGSSAGGGGSKEKTITFTSDVPENDVAGDDSTEDDAPGEPEEPIEVVNETPAAPVQSGDGGTGGATDPIIADGVVKVVAGRVTTLSAASDGAESVRIVNGVEHGTVTVNPDGTFALVMTQSDFVGTQGFTYEATHSDGTTSLHELEVNVVAGQLAGGWGTGESHYMLATDENDRVIVEHGDVHTKVYVTSGAHGLSREDIAEIEGLSVEAITNTWLANNDVYGRSEELALNESLGTALWKTITPSNVGTSNWFLLESGYEYANLGNFLPGHIVGESEIHPVYIGAWGEGDKPEITSLFESAGTRAMTNLVVQGISFSGGIRFVRENENVIFDDISVTDTDMVVMNSDGITIRNSDFTDVYLDESRDGGDWEAHLDRTSGIYSQGVEGLLMEGNFFDHNGWAPDYLPDGSAEGGHAPNMFNHNIYIDHDVWDITMRDTITMRGSSFGAQIRGGVFLEDNIFIDNNAAFKTYGGEYAGAGPVGQYSLLSGNVVTSGAHKTAEMTGALTLGIADDARMSTLVDNIVAHLSDPNNPAELDYKEHTHDSVRTHDSVYYDDTIVYNWQGSRPVYDGQITEQNTEGLDTAVLDQTTIQLFTAQLLGKPDATISDLADYLRAQADGAFDDIVDADLIIQFFREGFGLEIDDRLAATTLRFVPDDLGEGVRWDNRINWDTEDLPGTVAGDSVNLGGNHVVFGTNADIDEMSLSGGALNVYGGRLDVMGGITDGGHVNVEGAGQIWVGGHSGDDLLDVDISSGRFANTGAMSNTDLDVRGGQAILATGGAEFDVSAGRTLAIFEAAAKVGFDGNDGGMAILDLHEGGTLAYSAASGDLGTIQEFRSGAMGDAPDVLSGIDLGGATLEIDLAGLSAEAGTEFTLMASDEIAGALGETLVGGLGGRNATIVVDYLNDTVTLKLAAGSGLVSVETVGEQTDVTSGAEALWDALTADHGLAEDQPLPEEEELLDAVA